MIKIGFYILIAILLITTVSCNSSKNKQPHVQNGFLDLSEWNFEEDGTVDLNGEWEFYWEQLIEPDDFATNDSLKLEYISVPGGWAAERPETKSYPEFGYATYRLIIKTPNNSTDYRFIFSSIWSSTIVWINNSFCFEKGKVGNNKNQSNPEFLKDHILENKFFSNKNNSIEIIIQVADFFKGKPKSGIDGEISFGPKI